jgi:pre-rRNA-processing protein TSR3
MKLFAILFQQDDPSKCTASRLVKFRLVRRVNRPRYRTLILNPFSKAYLFKKDRDLTSDLCVIDCSWEKSREMLQEGKWRYYPFLRRLPALLAGNPINYAKLGKLSSVEALAGALVILGYNDQATTLLDKFKWGHTFYELNSSVLKEYAQADSEREVSEIQSSYFEQLA